MCRVSLSECVFVAVMFPPRPADTRETRARQHAVLHDEDRRPNLCRGDHSKNSESHPRPDSFDGFVEYTSF